MPYDGSVRSVRPPSATWVGLGWVTPPNLLGTQVVYDDGLGSFVTLWTCRESGSDVTSNRRSLQSKLPERHPQPSATTLDIAGRYIKKES